MARAPEILPAGMRLTDHISVGVLTAQFPRATVEQVLTATDRHSVRERALPDHVMLSCVIALALNAEASTLDVLRCVVEGARWLGDPTTTDLPSKSAISQARTRLGDAPVAVLYRAVVAPIATVGTPGAWYRGWRAMSLDGTTLAYGNVGCAA